MAQALKNTPDVKMGLVGVSRDCFPVELARRRLNALADECRKLKLNVVACSTVIESEEDALVALAEMEQADVNAVSIYLGNFGPEGPTAIFAEKLARPFMLIGAAEESGKDLINGRGDAFCGMLNACLNAGLRRLHPYVPRTPVGLPAELACEVAHFIHVARVLIGVRNLKVLSFGPRPQDFFACNAPIKPLYDAGIEVMENSELDLYLLFKDAAGRKKEIDAIAADMARELGAGNQHPEKLTQLAQLEAALTTFYEKNLGSRHFGVFANKCWPSFERAFGCVPCYVNSRLAGRGIPVACEVDIYGAVSEYMAQLASSTPATLLDINNTVPADIKIKDLKGATHQDLFMGFHCGNTPICHLSAGCAMKFQLIMNRLMEKPGEKPDITCGTLEGTLRPGPVTLFRLQADLRTGGLMTYVAEGSVLDADPASFGGIGIIGVKDFARFYRFVLLEKQYPHHAALAFKRVGRTLFDAAHVLGVGAIHTPRPPTLPYPEENPFVV
jgi:L-fucose isomerase-like protein